MFSKYFRLFHTVRFLKPVQILHQILFRLTKPTRLSSSNLPGKVAPFEFIHRPFLSGHVDVVDETVEFDFLNLQKSYDRELINWNENSLGKLWTYNLNYFEYLLGPDLKTHDGFRLIRLYLNSLSEVKDGLEPYPTSLRIMNWIKFLIASDQFPEDITNSIYHQSHHLRRRLEYHLLGNHILENGFALFFAAYFFQDSALYDSASKILNKQLEEQVLGDGAHFELSPMYHQIMLYRLLDCYQITKNAKWQPDPEVLLDRYISKMLGWLQQISLSNNIPLLNDSAPGVCGHYSTLHEYADDLLVKGKKTGLSESGYRKFEWDGMEMVLDIGKVGPDYQPGHAHADTFSFELWYDGRPIIVDPGISTYEKNEIRELERSTLLHNTLCIDNKNSSDVWGGFRVGRRARVQVEKEETNVITASHDGYKLDGLIHRRSFQIEQGIVIHDEILGNSEGKNIISCLHFHFDLLPTLAGNIIRAGDILLEFDGYTSLELKSYNFAAGFNFRKKSTKLVARLQPLSKITLHHAN